MIGEFLSNPNQDSFRHANSVLVKRFCCVDNAQFHYSHSSQSDKYAKKLNVLQFTGLTSFWGTRFHLSGILILLASSDFIW